MKRSRTETTIEMEEVLVIRGERRTSPCWCAQCGEWVRLVTPEQAAVLARVSWREIYRRVEGERIHSLDTAEGALLICLKSLSADSAADTGFCDLYQYREARK